MIDRERMLASVRRGLTRKQKELPSRYFYDHRGSELFEEITRLDEYYLTDVERALLGAWISPWVEEVRPRSLVELGAGNAEKTRILLDAMTDVRDRPLFIPLDVSADYLKSAASALREEYPRLDVRPEVADFTAPLDFSVDVPSPKMLALLGSTIGNFDPAESRELLGHVRAVMDEDDVFLLGVDLRPSERKPVEVLEAAYDDPRGVTAEFNLNMLRVLNREIGTDFALDSFEHRAFYDAGEGRIEMHLVARGPQAVRLPDGAEVSFEDGETVRTEISTKYDRPVIESLLSDSGMSLRKWREDDAGLYALVLAVPA